MRSVCRAILAVPQGASRVQPHPTGCCAPALPQLRQPFMYIWPYAEMATGVVSGQCIYAELGGKRVVCKMSGIKPEYMLTP